MCGWTGLRQGGRTGTAWVGARRRAARHGFEIRSQICDVREAVRFRLPVGATKTLVGQVCGGFGQRTKEWRAADPSHGKYQRECHQRFFVWMVWKDHAQCCHGRR